MRTQRISDRESIVGVNRRRLANDGSGASILPQRDQYPFEFECFDSPAITAITAFIGDDEDDDLSPPESRCQKKRGRPYISFRLVILSPYLAIILLLIGTTPIVQAQDSTIAPTVPVTPAVPDPEVPNTSDLESIEVVAPTTATATAPVAPLLPAPTLPATTAAPTLNPTFSPTASPTISMAPSVTASGEPSAPPTVSAAPTTPQPSAQPTMEVPMLKETKFRQEFQVGNGREFNDDELSLFQTLYQRYTVDFAPIPASEVEEKITTVCTVDKQTFLFTNRKRRLQKDKGLISYLRRGLRGLEDVTVEQETDTLNVDYTMSYESRHYNVTEYPKLFQNWTTNNLNVVLEQMQFLNFDVVSVNVPRRILVRTPAPTISVAPSEAPTLAPTTSPRPSNLATEEFIPTLEPTEVGAGNGFGQFNIIIISVSLIIAVAIIAIGLFLFYRKRRTNRDDSFINASKRSSVRGSEMHSNMRWASSNRGDGHNPSYTSTSETKAYGSSYGRHSDAPTRLADAVSSPPGSLVSSQSLISRGNSMGGDSREEDDAAHTLVDEFDQYKDQNLEKMRAEIEGLPECDGMMSQAVAKALIDQDDELVLSSYWGGDQDITPEEIEASALGFVLDWLKRNGKVSDREKRSIMQKQLNKMTASVLHKVIGPEDATRTIHEIAVLLGLRLSSELPMTTILVAGMRQKAREADMRRTFGMFGDVTVAAVAPNERGFGIVRFKTSNAVNRLMVKYRKEDIVVEDVAVQLIVIKAGLNLRDAIDNGGAELL